MGYDSSIKIKKKMIKDVSDSLIEIGYLEKKVRKSITPCINFFRFYKDDNYKFFEGVSFSISKIDNEYYLCGRNSIYASDYDIIEHNKTIKYITQKYNLSFETDYGKNTLFPNSKKPTEGLINGLYFAYWKINNQLSQLRYFSDSIRKQTEQEKELQKFFGNIFQGEIYGSNICIIHLVTIMELFFKNLFTVLISLNLTEEQINNLFNLRYPYKEKYENNEISLIEAVANSCSFQNIESICRNFKKIDNNIDLKKLYSLRSRYYSELDRIFKQRHENVHLLIEDEHYNYDKFIKDYSLVEKAMQKCYRYLCKLYKVKYLK